MPTSTAKDLATPSPRTWLPTTKRSGVEVPCFHLFKMRVSGYWGAWLISQPWVPERDFAGGNTFILPVSADCLLLGVATNYLLRPLSPRSLFLSLTAVKCDISQWGTFPGQIPTRCATSPWILTLRIFIALRTWLWVLFHLKKKI